MTFCYLLASQMSEQRSLQNVFVVVTTNG